MSEKREIDAEGLLLRINAGKEVPLKEWREIEELLGRALSDDLPREMSLDDVYTFLVAAQKAERKDMRPLMERFLDRNDPLTVSLVLETLCLDWNLVDDYFERVTRFAIGVAWDLDSDVQQTALKIIGEYLATRIPERVKKREPLHRHEKELLKLVLEVFQDETVETWARHGAYYALLRAAGYKRDALPAECKHFEFERSCLEVDWRAIDELHSLVV